MSHTQVSEGGRNHSFPKSFCGNMQKTIMEQLAMYSNNTIPMRKIISVLQKYAVSPS